MEYKNSLNATECSLSMNGFNLGGVQLIVDTVDQAMAAALKGLSKILRHHSSKKIK